MTGPGRPPTGERVQVRIPADLLAELDKIDTNRAATIRAAIRYYLEHHR